ncbi:uncharacterized protein LOC106009570 [Heterocephalus glaber]|uniref:Uncharacterized protein LOC106009570 n=1 Tax=Heterocephalus glaber TaxID=10181 RepID=A0AAX6T498_HETGA|nr:uncharacterized protein LOC106009570 [Heterocephalus glaber]
MLARELQGHRAGTALPEESRGKEREREGAAAGGNAGSSWESERDCRVPLDLHRLSDRLGRRGRRCACRGVPGPGRTVCVKVYVCLRPLSQGSGLPQRPERVRGSSPETRRNWKRNRRISLAVVCTEFIRIKPTLRHPAEPALHWQVLAVAAILSPGGKVQENSRDLILMSLGHGPTIIPGIELGTLHSPGRCGTTEGLLQPLEAKRTISSFFLAWQLKFHQADTPSGPLTLKG